MAFDMRLISRLDHGLFASSWVAASGRSFLKALKRQDIEGINIGQICENLLLIIEKKEDLMHNEKDSSIAIKTNQKIPFRVVSKLCFGTLRIYQQQVHCLLEKTQDLLTRSKGVIKTVMAIKSNCSDVYRRSNGKWQVSTQNILITEYSHVLMEAENLVHWATVEELLTMPTWTDNIVGRTKRRRNADTSQTHVNISEITHREEVFVDNDDEEGFGDATSDELAQWLEFCPERTPFATLSRSVMPEVPNDMRCIISEHSDIDRSIDEARSQQGPLTVLDDLHSFQVPAFRNSVVSTPVPNCNTPYDNRDPSSTQRAGSPIKATNISKKKRKTREHRLVIDQFTVLSEEELRQQMENYSKPQRPAATKRILPKKQTVLSANELLSQLNRRNISKCDLNRKRKICPDKISMEYHTTLSEILGRDVDDDLVAEVLGWSEPGSSSQKRKRPTVKASTVMADPIPMEVIDDCANIEPMEVIDDCANIKRARLKPQMSGDWHVCGVMTKLIILLKHAGQDQTIDAGLFFSTVHNRVDAALAFSTLMTLAAKKFVVLINCCSSNDLKSIKVCPAGKKFVCDVYFKRNKA